MNIKIVQVGLLVISLLMCPRADAGSGSDFDPLLARVPSSSQAVIVVDLAEVGRMVKGFLDRVQNTAVVAENPDLKNLFGMQRAMLDSAVNTLATQMKVDPYKDLNHLVIGLELSDPNKPEMVVVVSGKLPPDLLAKLMEEEGAQPERVDQREIYRLPEGMAVAQLDSLIVLASANSLNMALAGGQNVAELKKNHPLLSAPLPKEFLLRSSVVLPQYVQALADQEEAKMFRTLLKSIRRIEAEVGAELVKVVHCADASGAERARLLMDGWSEVMLGGAHMYRAYALFILGFDFSKMPGVPPQLSGALANRKAMKKSIDEFFPQPGAKPKVELKGTSVRLTTPPRMMQGATFVLGIVAAIAIPAFIKYLQKSREAGTKVEMAMLRTALDTYKLDHMKYPTAEEGLDILVKKGFLNQIPKDAYGNSFVYLPTADGFTLKSLGRDNMPGGYGPDQDVVLEH